MNIFASKIFTNQELEDLSEAYVVYDSYHVDIEFKTLLLLITFIVKSRT